MSNTIIIKKSETQGTAPTTSNLALGELAVNTYDGDIFLKKKVGATESIVKISAAEGTYVPYTGADTDVNLGSQELTTSGHIRRVTIPVTVATAAATAAKTATIANYNNEVKALIDGDLFAVTFTSGNTAASPTLNINVIGAKNIRCGTVNASATTFTLGANATVILYYDAAADKFQQMGSYRTSDSNTTYAEITEAEITTGTATTLRTITGRRAKFIADRNVSTTAPLALSTTSAGVTGTSLLYAREDHRHGMPTLNQVLAPTGNVALGLYRITDLAEPVTDSDAANKSYVDDVAVTNLGTAVVSTNSRSITSSTGTDITVPVATITVAGFMSHTDKDKLDGVASGATDNVGTVTSVGVTSGTGIGISGSASPITSSGSFTITNTSPNATHTGDVTGSGALTIANAAVTNAKMANMSPFTMKGLDVTTPGPPKDLTQAEVRTLLNVADGATANVGTVTSVGATGGTGISISGSPITTSGSITITNSAPNATHTGDVTGSGALTIANGAVTNAKIAAGAVNTQKLAPMVPNTFIGRVTTGLGDPEFLTATQARTILNVADGAQANVATNLSNGPASGTSVRVDSSTGTNVTLPVASTTAAGVVTNADQSFAGVKTFNARVVIDGQANFNQQLTLRRNSATGGGVVWGIAPSADHTAYSAKNALRFVAGGSSVASITVDGDITTEGGGYFGDNLTVTVPSEPTNSRTLSIDSNGVFGYREDWNYFADKWSTAPTEVGTVSSPVNGRVFSYTLNSVTRYRLVPDTYAPANDSFYGTYTGGVLSNLITSRSS